MQSKQLLEEEIELSNLCKASTKPEIYLHVAGKREGKDEVMVFRDTVASYRGRNGLPRLQPLTVL